MLNNEQELFDQITDLACSVSLIDQMFLTTYQEDYEISFKLPENESPIKDSDFFAAHKYNFIYFQNAEELIYDHLDLSQVFFAYEKEESVGTNFDGTEIFDLYICLPN